MIEILIEHSKQEDYYVIDEIIVTIKKAREKERVEQLIEENELVGTFVSYDENLPQNLADLLGVDVELIVIDTFEIDDIAEE